MGKLAYVCRHSWSVNAVAESFFATIKKELVHRRSWPTRRELQSAVFDYIDRGSGDVRTWAVD